MVASNRSTASVGNSTGYVAFSLDHARCQPFLAGGSAVLLAAT
jgi:hypothetical protein